MNNEIIMNISNNIDWNFGNIRTYYGVHTFHWYSSTFVPQIPNICISSFSKEGDTILDSFCGSGTSLVEASDLRRKFIGIDLNPFAIFISKVKTTPIDEELVLKEFTKMKDHLTNRQKSLFQSFEDDNNIKLHNFIDMNLWYHKKTLFELNIIKNYIYENIENHDIRDLFILTLSDRLNYCSIHSKRTYGYIADNCTNAKKYKRHYINAITAFLKKLEKNIGILKKDHINPLFNNEFYIANSKDLSFIENDTIDFIVTSPPYPIVTDYNMGFRLSYYFLNDYMDNFIQKHGKNVSMQGINSELEYLNFFKKKEIGARYRRHNKNRYHDYLNDMKTSISQINEKLKENKYAVFVISGEEKIGISDCFINMFKENNFSIIKIIKRNISKNRVQYNNLDYENIYILKK